MAEAAWEKPQNMTTLPSGGGRERLKFLVGGLLILGAVAYLILSGTLAGANYYLTVDELLANPNYQGKTVRIAGAVIGESIQYDGQNLKLDFTIVNVPVNYTNLAEALHNAVNNPNGQRIAVHVVDQPKPDLLQHEAQAILTGVLGEDGVFYATEVNLKCPTRFEEAQPGQSIIAPEAG